MGDALIDKQNNNIPEPKSFYIESGQFHTSFGKVKGSKFIIVFNTQANNAFKHEITLSNKTVLLISTPNPCTFNLSTHSHNNDMEFNALFIDLRASTQWTEGIGQIKRLQ